MHGGGTFVLVYKVTFLENVYVLIYRDVYVCVGHSCRCTEQVVIKVIIKTIDKNQQERLNIFTKSKKKKVSLKRLKVQKRNDNNNNDSSEL